MGRAPLADPILTRFRAVLDDLYGSRLERVVLFGSRARGDARPDSDCVAGYCRTGLMFDRGVAIDALPVHPRIRSSRSASDRRAAASAPSSKASARSRLRRCRATMPSSMLSLTISR